MIVRRSALAMAAAAPVLVATGKASNDGGRHFGRSSEARRQAVRRIFSAWEARDRVAFQAEFHSLQVDGREMAEDRYRIFDATDVFGDLLIGEAGSRCSVEDLRTFGNSELAVIFVRWDQATRDDGRWHPLAYLFNVTFGRAGGLSGDKILELAPVANYSLDLVDG